MRILSILEQAFFDRNCHVFNTFLSPDLIATKKWSAKKKNFPTTNTMQVATNKTSNC